MELEIMTGNIRNWEGEVSNVLTMHYIHDFIYSLIDLIT